MQESPNQPKSLSEISHLFLSGIREKQTQGSPRPLRMPPQKARTDVTIDLSPEEFAEVFGDKVQGSREEAGPKIGPVQAIIASHFGPHQLARAQEYASHICTPGQRIGLIAVDASEFRLSIFEHNPHPQSTTAQASESEVLEPRKMAESLEELSWDVDRWLVLLPSTRAPEARSLLRDISHWTLLLTCDHEGIVASYRTLKGLSDLHRPRLSLATLDAASESDAAGACQRLASVCRQFLDWHIESESPIAPSSDVTEHVVLWSIATRDKAQLATAPQWQVASEFLKRARKHEGMKKLETSRKPATIATPVMPESIPFPTFEKKTSPAKAQEAELHAIPMPQAAAATNAPEVIELPDHASSPAAIVSAVLHGNASQWVECPVKPPMCADASLAVSRDHRLVLVAVAQQGLSDLRQIGRAYQWLIENRPLIGMAVPQLSIDPHQHPQLHLLVDHADMSAEILQPILQSDSVSVHAYRKLRWGGKIGLLLEAA